jgi:hypothetical protein
VAEQLDEARRDLALSHVALAAQDVAQVVDRRVVVAPVGTEVLELHGLVQGGIHHLQRAVPDDEEARLDGDRRRGEAEHERDDGPHRTKAPTCPARASRMRMVEMSIRSSGSRSGSNQSSSSDSLPHSSSAGADHALSKTLLT